MSPKEARVMMRMTRGPTAFNDMPNIKADIYLGGKIPARPTMLELRIAMQMPKLIIVRTENLKAMSTCKK
jgi:hypothetical protein